MAIRKKVRTVTMLTVSGETSPVMVTTTYLKSLRKVRVTFEGEPANMFYNFTEVCRDRPQYFVNHNATEFLYQDGPKPLGTWFGGVSGAAYFAPLDNEFRYTRVVSIRETQTIRDDFTKWAAEQFPAEYRPVYLYDSRGSYVACEHPDERTRDAWLTFSKVRWG